MSEFDSDPDLARLEAQLRRRARPHPSAALEQRVLSQIERAVARERRANVVAVAACVAAMIGLQVLLHGLGPARGTARAWSTVSLRERVEVHLSLEGFELLDHSDSRLPRLAPVLGAKRHSTDVRGL